MFIPKCNVPLIYQFKIGYQNFIVIYLTFNDDIIFDRFIEYLFLNNYNFYWFSDENEMFSLDELVNNTNDDYYIVIG